MDDYIIYLALAILIIVVLAFLTNYRKSNDKGDVGSTEEENEAPVLPRPRQLVAEPAAPGGLRNRAAVNRNARARMRVAQAQRQISESDNEDEELEDDDITLPQGKFGKKKLAKLQMKAEKRAMRETEEREREEKREREEMKMEKRRQIEKEEEEEEKKKEEEERLKREEEERKEQEEYEKMKAQFHVDEEGFDEGDDQERQTNLLQEFIEYIKKNKVVVIEDLAATFNLKAQTVIDRITELQKDGTLTGVIDDRGKFIFINQSELESVAKFIHQQGRISVADLAEASNSLINLTPQCEA